ncbi:hypothetical protein [Luteolibacter sp. AS25]|uniref:hypothetical protein n=1 Tax=Luteolibacter sp. AS25 TaxID=3135776 RepID=UPI00398B974F
MKTIPNIAVAILTASLCVSCDKSSSEPILRGGYETAKVSVTVAHVPTTSGGGGVIDTDQGVSERKLWGESGSGKRAERYRIRNVTATGFTLEYEMTIENPIGSTPRPFNGRITVPYAESVTEEITDDYTLTVSANKP